MSDNDDDNTLDVDVYDEVTEQEKKRQQVDKINEKYKTWVFLVTFLYFLQQEAITITSLCCMRS